MNLHPYSNAPAHAFWSRAVSKGPDPENMHLTKAPLIKSGDRVASAGSCFAANLVPYLERSGLEYVRTEYQEGLWGQIPGEAFSYGKFSAGYGNIYTPRQMLQLIQRCRGQFAPMDDRIHLNGRVIDMFRPGLKYAARSNIEFDRLTKQHLESTLKAFSTCDIMIFTLGLTEAWVSKLDGAVFPACPGTIAGDFDPERHAFVNFSCAETSSDLISFISALKEINPDARVILTVSPVPLVATATDNHVVPATVYSKSVLRVAAEEAARAFEHVTYFPSYEIVCGPQAPEDYFEADRRNVSQKGIDSVMRVFLAACSVDQPAPHSSELVSAPPAPVNASSAPAPQAHSNASALDLLSRAIVEKDCEEAMSDSQ